MYHIVVDEDIPYVQDWLGSVVTLHALPASKITTNSLQNADGLLIRTLTKIDQSIISSCPKLQFIASATSGIDHIASSLLHQKTPSIFHAPGCNAQAVCDYVRACFTAVNQTKRFGRVGIIGLGHVGSLVKDFFSNLGFETLCYDPPKAALDPTFISSSKADLRDLDVLCIHPSLTTHGQHKSIGLVDACLLSQQAPNTLIIQASRGPVCDESALIAEASRLTLCVDVWQNEPRINPILFQKVKIATPHIAGYSTLAKWEASKSVTTALCQHFQHPVPTMHAPNLSDCHPLDVFAIDHTWRKSSDPSSIFHHMRKKELRRR